MGYFKKKDSSRGNSSYRGGDRDGGRGGFSKRNDFSRGGDSERKELFETVCDECGKDCKVPFKPTGDRPVYCSDCFRAREENSENTDRGNRSFNNDRPERRFERAPERSFEKPVVQNHELSKIMDQLNSMNTKMEKLLRIIESLSVKVSTQVTSKEKTEPAVPTVIKEKKSRAKKAK